MSLVEPPGVRDAAVGWLRLLLPVAVGAAAFELVVLRVFTRTIIHIPGAQAVSPVLTAASEAGRFSYYLASVLITLTLLLLVVVLWSARVDRRSVVAVALLVAAASLARAGVVDALPLALTTCTSVVLLVSVVVEGSASRARVPLACFGAGFLLAGGYAALESPTVASSAAAPAPSILLIGAEALTLVGALTSPLLLDGRLERRSIGVGLAAGTMATAALLADPSITKILMLWNLGLAGYFPAAAYGLALGALAATITHLARSGARATAAAIALVAMGGIGLHSTYQSALVVAGLGVAALVHARAPAEHAPRPPAADGALIKTPAVRELLTETEVATATGTSTVG